MRIKFPRLALVIADSTAFAEGQVIAPIPPPKRAAAGHMMRPLRPGEYLDPR